MHTLDRATIDKWRRIGREDQRAGVRCVPAASPRIMEYVKSKTGPATADSMHDTAQVCKAWLAGWTAANLSG